MTSGLLIMAYRVPTSAALWQFASDLLFVTGALGAMFIDYKIHQSFQSYGRLARPIPSRRDLYGLTVICLLFTLLIAAATLLPIIVGLNQPGGLSVIKQAGPRSGMYLVVAWTVNACYCIWAVLRFTYKAYPNRLRWGAASAVALVSLAAALHNYCWMVAPSALPRVIGRQAATAMLVIMGFICLLSARKLVEDAQATQTGSLFDWARLRIRVFGWFILCLNSVIFMLWYIKTIRITRLYLPQGWDTTLPLLVNAMLVIPYLRLRDTTSGSRRMSNVMFAILAMQLILFWALTRFMPHQA